MIISASRRTDIPACHSEWFFNRLREGFVLVRNPMNFHQVSRIPLTPDLVDGIVFWSKNPAPMIPHLNLLKDYAYYFQFTLTPYGQEIEKNLPSKTEVLLPVFQKLSDSIGPGRVIWRYDPILINDTWTAERHIDQFGRMAHQLNSYTGQVVISFIDLYQNTKRHSHELSLQPMTEHDMKSIAKAFSEIAAEYRLTVTTCSETIDLDEFGIRHGSCIDKTLLERISGCSLSPGKDKNQRSQCGCASSIDIGTYNACSNGCSYCYANYSPSLLERNKNGYDSQSPLLCSALTESDTIKIRQVSSVKDNQIKLPFL
ncbi:DUF1848 family protein [Clostridium sp. MCC353]|uniref:DUF1848 domain-containing protein n=1 Tax=Clostridium sp. MCC353 TaxID=2592646 RepID=UPI001C02016A|nr:DUF1848 domain-containing protein [Clostridium sp. MCC353]MBT9777639.1 DUF1848 family protein [Clostridium sp. MCC353]